MTNALTNADRCPICHGMLAIIGRVHRCVPRVVVAEISPDPTPETVRGAQEFLKAAQETTYRYRDPEKWRAYMRDYMRRKRAKGATDGRAS